MNIALLTAGGVGSRMEQDIPKQFMTIFDKPVIIYTLEAFQSHEEIDAIGVVCLAGWESFLLAYAKQYGITKLQWVFPGGDTNHASIAHGVRGLREAGCADDDVILVHDGVRALVSSRIISENIDVCRRYSYAVTGMRSKEVIMKLDGEQLLSVPTPREQIIRTQTPQTYRFGMLWNAFNRADELGLQTIAPCDLWAKLGVHEQHLVLGSERNSLKLTQQEDIDLFKSLIELELLRHQHAL